MNERYTYIGYSKILIVLARRDIKICGEIKYNTYSLY